MCPNCEEIHGLLKKLMAIDTIASVEVNDTCRECGEPVRFCYVKPTPRPSGFWHAVTSVDAGALLFFFLVSCFFGFLTLLAIFGKSPK